MGQWGLGVWLQENLEWNLKINSLSDGKIVKNIMDEFLENFKIATVVNETYIQNYKKRYEELKKIKKKGKLKLYI